MKKKYKWLIYWIVVAIAILFVSVAVYGASPIAAGISDCIDATCRVTTADGSRGTGCAFEKSQGRIFVLTAAHVVGNNRTVRCEFWRHGHQSTPLPGEVIVRSESVDAAIVAIPESIFGGLLPKVIPLAPRDYTVRPGQTVTSVGCANGSWSTGWKGHVLGYQGLDLHFVPTPADGRSGSAVFDAGGEMIVALLRARTLDGSQGIATSVEGLYQVFGPQTANRRSDSAELVAGPIPNAPSQGTQCPGGICPSPTPWRLSPYRHQQDEQDRQQDGRIGQLERVWPTLPSPTPAPSPAPSIDLSEVTRKLDQVIELLGDIKSDQQAPPLRQPAGPLVPVEPAEAAVGQEALKAVEEAKAEAAASKEATAKAVAEVKQESSQLRQSIEQLIGDRETLRERFDARIAKVKEELGAEAGKGEIARAYVKDLAGEKLSSGAVGMTVGKILAGVLGLSGPLAFATAGGAWLISRRIGRKIEAGEPLLVERLLGGLGEKIDDLKDRLDDDQPGKTTPRRKVRG